MNRGSQGSDGPCHLCGSTDLEVAPGHEALQRVTSDCKPWPPGGGLARCRACNLVQTVVGPVWREEAERIYAGYTIYHQSGGCEQRVFDGSGGVGRPRSEQIVAALQRTVRLADHGRLLDIGCGNGSFLTAWSRAVSGWRLAGSEVNDKYRGEVEAIAGVEGLFVGELSTIPGRFDVISLVHVLEHVPGPVALLRQVREKLNPGGLVVVEVPDCAENPFMLLVADHCSHFSPGLLSGVVAAAGFEVIIATNTWVAKEVSVAGRCDGGTGIATGRVPLAADESKQVFAGWQELERIRRRVEPLARRPAFGLFGTAIAATWLDAQTGRAPQFFVDEDVNRIGKLHFGRPILAPGEVPRGATVFVALPRVLAGKVAGRLRALGRDLEVVEP